MTDLLERVLDAHGGLDRWKQVRSLTAHLDFGGPFWAGRGRPGVLEGASVRVDTAREAISFTPYTGPGRTLHYDVSPDGAERLTLLGPDGQEIETRDDPRTSFPPYAAGTPWDALQTAYFASVATWNYLMEPWLFTWPDVSAVEIEPWSEDGETWRRLAVTFPARLPNHNPDQVFFFGEDFLMRRMDYHPDVTGSAIAHYVTEPEEFGGLVFYTRRLVFGRRPDGTAEKSLAFITIDTSSIEVDAAPQAY